MCLAIPGKVASIEEKSGVALAAFRSAKSLDRLASILFRKRRKAIT